MKISPLKQMVGWTLVMLLFPFMFVFFGTVYLLNKYEILAYPEWRPPKNGDRKG